MTVGSMLTHVPCFKEIRMQKACGKYRRHRSGILYACIPYIHRHIILLGTGTHLHIHERTQHSSPVHSHSLASFLLRTKWNYLSCSLGFNCWPIWGMVTTIQTPLNVSLSTPWGTASPPGSIPKTRREAASSQSDPHKSASSHPPPLPWGSMTESTTRLWEGAQPSLSTQQDSGFQWVG